MKKKILTICFSIALVICMSGCGNKTNNKKLTCVQNDSNLIIKIDMTFKNNKLDTMKINNLYDLAKLNQTEEQVKSVMKSDDDCNDLGLLDDSYKSSVLSCKYEISNKKLSIDTTYDVNKIEDSVIKSDKSYSNIKEYFEMQSLTCK